jgi:hypothetical protein
MTDKTLQQGIELWRGLSESLNAIIEDSGEIDINNELIWKGYLHSWDNQDWTKALLAIEALFEEHPEFFRGNNEDAFLTAKEILIKNNNKIDRILDRKANKRHAWRMIMTMRELWNAANDIFLPNSKDSIKRNHYSDIFEDA